MTLFINQILSASGGTPSVYVILLLCHLHIANSITELVDFKADNGKLFRLSYIRVSTHTYFLLNYIPVTRTKCFSSSFFLRYLLDSRLIHQLPCLQVANNNQHNVTLINIARLWSTMPLKYSEGNTNSVNINGCTLFLKTYLLSNPTDLIAND